MELGEKMKRVEISVIVPIYNIENYLNKCLNSLVEQDFEDYEIILIDDGSNDCSGEICEIWKKKSEKIRVYHIENHGVSFARNMGIEKSKGNYIMFVDGDDWIENNMLSSMYRLVKDNKPDIVMCNMYLDYENGKKEKCNFYQSENLEFDKKGVEKLLKMWGPSCKLYKKDIINEIRFSVSMTCGEDLFFNSQIIFEDKIFRMVTTENSFYHYFQRNGSAIRSDFKTEWYDSFERECIIAEKLEKKYGEILNTELVKNGMGLFLSGFSNLHIKEMLFYRKEMEYFKKQIKKNKRFVLKKSEDSKEKILILIKVYFPWVFVITRRGIKCLLYKKMQA